MIKLTTIGRQHLFGPTNFADETDIKYMFFDTSVTSANVESICENWTHSSTDLSKLASQSKQIFTNLRYETSGYMTSVERTISLLSDSSPITSDFTKDTGGYAAVINNANECLGHIKVMQVSASVINAISGAEQSWKNKIVCSVDLHYKYSPDWILTIFTGETLLDYLEFIPVIVNDYVTSLPDKSHHELTAVGYTSEADDRWNSHINTELSNNVPINNLRLEGDKFVFDDQFIEFSSTESYEDVEIAVVAVNPVNGTTRLICFLSPKENLANGGIYVSCGPDGIFNFV